MLKDENKNRHVVMHKIERNLRINAKVFFLSFAEYIHRPHHAK